MFEDNKQIEEVLKALAEQLAKEAVHHLELVVCGGAALKFLGYAHRTTLDVDVLAIVERSIDVVAYVDKDKDGKQRIEKAEPLKPIIIKAVQRVAKDFNLPDNWLNAKASAVMDFGLPQGLMERVETRTFGRNLVVHFLSRYDQIHFKVYAAVDQSGGKHLDDLLELTPMAEELETAALWSMTHDPSEGYKMSLKAFLEQIGHKDVAGKL